MPAAAAALGDLLGYHLARVIACNVRPDAERAPSAALRRCLDFLEGHSRGRIDLVDVAHHANISLRSAQALFARELGTSITAHLRHIRLERVRRRIEAGTCVTIAATALEEGFTHLGEVGQSYLTRFGERPFRHTAAQSPPLILDDARVGCDRLTTAPARLVRKNPKAARGSSLRAGRDCGLRVRCGITIGSNIDISGRTPQHPRQRRLL
ncbi:helix-turn-helix domain-containing protein, partial [Sandarakinorhabdus sp.]|uniref:helix-turn-helix domain-containing protein n=1 Tax=Sandarakinorhabdus sp. TaxID=1916663 RepID=UPI003340637F